MNANLLAIPTIDADEPVVTTAYETIQFHIYAVRVGMVHGELLGPQVDKMAKVLMIMHRVFWMVASQKIQAHADDLLMTFKAMSQRYNCNGDKPLKVNADFVAKFNTMITSFEKLIERKAISEIGLAQACEYVMNNIARTEQRQ